MAPVFLLVAGTAVGVVLSLRVLAKHQLRQALESAPNACEYAQVHLHAASHLIERLRLAAATKQQGAARDASAAGLLKGDPLVAKARTELHRVLELCPETPMAEQDLALVELYDGNTSESWYRQGLFQAKSGKTAEAIISLQTALQEDPGLLRAVPRLAVLLSDAGRESEALALVQEHEAELASTAEGKLLLGRLYVRSSPEKAEGFLRAGLEEQPLDARAVWELFGIFERSGRAKEGADFLSKLGAGGRRVVPEVYHAASLLHAAVGDFPSQEKMLRAALVLAPTNGPLMYALAVSLHRQGKKFEARDMMNRALEQDFDGVMRSMAQVGVDPRQ